MAKTPFSRAMDAAGSRTRFPVFKAVTLVAGAAAVLFVADTLLRDLREDEDEDAPAAEREGSSTARSEEDEDDADLD